MSSTASKCGAVLLAGVFLIGQPCLAYAADPFGDLKKLGTKLFGGQSDSSKKDEPPVTNTSQQEDSGFGKAISGAVGGVLGGLIGSRFGDGKGKIFTSATGALLGAWAGSELFSYLSETDQNALVYSTERAVETGENQSWRNPDTGVQTQVTVVGEEQRVQEVSIPVGQDSLSQLPPLTFIGKDYQSSKNVNIRKGPGTNFSKVGLLTQGQVVHVIGQVENDNWLMIKQGEVASGFVHGSFLTPSTASKSAATVATATNASQGTDPSVETKKVSMKQTCRKIEQTITLKDGTTKTETITACRGPNGVTVL